MRFENWAALDGVRAAHLMMEIMTSTHSAGMIGVAHFHVTSLTGTVSNFDEFLNEIFRSSGVLYKIFEDLSGII